MSQVNLFWQALRDILQYFDNDYFKQVTEGLKIESEYR